MPNLEKGKDKLNKRIKGSISDTRWFDLEQGCTYTGLGKNTFRNWARQIGAEIKIGRIVRYDKAILDGAMDQATARE